MSRSWRPCRNTATASAGTSTPQPRHAPAYGNFIRFVVAAAGSFISSDFRIGGALRRVLRSRPEGEPTTSRSLARHLLTRSAATRPQECRRTARGSGGGSTSARRVERRTIPSSRTYAGSALASSSSTSAWCGRAGRAGTSTRGRASKVAPNGPEVLGVRDHGGSKGGYCDLSRARFGDGPWVAPPTRPADMDCANRHTPAPCALALDPNRLGRHAVKLGTQPCVSGGT